MAEEEGKSAVAADLSQQKDQDFDSELDEVSYLLRDQGALKQVVVYQFNVKNMTSHAHADLI